jgi:hypothetical protein
MSVLALAALLALGLTACAPAEESGPTRTPIPTRTPLFASDEQALKAATEAYAAYLKMVNGIAHDGGRDVDRLRPLVSRNLFERESSGFEKTLANGRRTTGDSRFDTVSLERYDRTTEKLSAFLCLDVGNIRILDASGSDVTPAERPSRLPMSIQFALIGSKFLVSQSDTWPGKNFC